MEDQRAMTSMRVFREFLKRKNVNGREMVDANDVVSRECYDLWVSTRKVLPPNPEKAFQRALSAHITGVDGRVAFTPTEEEAILRVLRRKERWPCFEASSTRFGLMGFRAKGFHEKSIEGGYEAEPASTTKRAKPSEESEEETPRPALAQQPTAFPAGLAPALPADLSRPQMPMLNPSFLLGAPAATPGLLPMGAGLQPNMPFRMFPAAPLAAPQAGLPGAPMPGLDLESAFLDTAMMLCNQYVTTGVDSLGTIFSLARMTLMAKRQFQPRESDAKKLCDALTTLYPGHSVFIADVAGRTPTERVLAMNNAAVAQFGDLQRATSNYLVTPADMWPIISACMMAYRSSGTSFPVKANLLTLQGAREANVVITHHAAEQVFVARALV